jgi:hypothetical protein
MNNNDSDDNIRTPDPIRTDRLIDDYSNNFINPILDDKTNYDLDKVLTLSKNEFDKRQEEQEQKAIELIYSQMNEEQEKQRKDKFNNIKIQIHKILSFDKTDLYYYELILSIIEMFENGFITEYAMDEKEYTNIFRIIKTIRIPPDEINNLKKLILSE